MSNVDKIAEYFRRNYETEEGTVEENLDFLFADDVVYMVGDQQVDKAGLAMTGNKIRSSPKEGRSVIASHFREDGDTVHFHLSLKVPGMGPDGADMAVETDNSWTFNPDGKVITAVPTATEAVADAFREAGVDLE